MTTTSSLDKLIKVFYEYFICRTDVFNLQFKDGNYLKRQEELTPIYLYKHLSGEIAVNVHALDKNSMSKWIVFDVDRSPKKTVKKLVNYLNKTEYSKSFLVEKTGGRGYHLWVLFNRKYSAAVLRIIASEILNTVKVEGVEIFPKQDFISEEVPYGNTVRLPFGIHQKTGKRSVLIYPSSIDEVVRYKLSDKKLVEYSLEYMSGTKNNNKVFTPPKYSAFEGCIAFQRIRSGVSEGYRDEAAFLLARIYRWIGLPMADTYILLKEWNKLNEPPLSEYQIQAKVKQAYKNNYYVSLKSIRDNKILNIFCAGCKKEC